MNFNLQATVVFASAILAANCACSEELLYNGVRLPDEWPPRYASLEEARKTPPYLEHPPAVIPIDVGRQLFVDDFLIAESSLTRTHHRPTYHPQNPVLKPDKPWEHEVPENPTAMTFSDGVFYDPQDQLFKMWYMGGYVKRTCYATSRDGIHWEKPDMDVVPGTNVVHTATRDSNTVWLDQTTTDPKQRFKMISVHWPTDYRSISAYSSPDGIHWTGVLARSPETVMGDRHTMFYNPFRKVWVYSVRADIEGVGRMRRYREHPDFVQGALWEKEPAIWTGADAQDVNYPALNQPPQLYVLDCVAYESLIIGLFTIWHGERGIYPKQNEVSIGYSRDGFHWSRPDRKSFLPTSGEDGAWNLGNVQSTGGCCLVVGDKLYFYVSGRQGIPGTRESGVCSTGLATMRRDGFVSLDAGSEAGFVTTRPLTFSGRHLFVNANTNEGELTAEILDDQGQVIAPFSKDNCKPIHGDGVMQAVRWQGAEDLSGIAGKAVRMRFHLKDGQLFSFWVSPDSSGASHGYVAAGGPGFAGIADTVGSTSSQ